MTAEKTLLLTNAALLHLRDNSPENVRDILQALKEDAEQNIRNAAAKSAGRFSRTDGDGVLLPVRKKARA